jgi:tetratricopeptide (TPR) repeat protein
MRLDLQSPLRKLAFAGLCLVCVGLYLYLAVRPYVAFRLASVPEFAHLQKAIRLEPSNSEYRERLGQYLTVSTSNGNLDDAIASYQEAVHLNPYVSRYWLELAQVFQVAGRIDDQKQSVQQAVEAEATTPRVAWEAANFFLVQGDQQRALSTFRIVLENDSELVNAALQVCWRATGDANQLLDQAIPARPDLYFSFLQLLISKEEVAASKTVWNRLIALQQPFSVPLALPYFRFLLSHQEVAAAQNAWRELATVDHSLDQYLPSPANLIVNGSFEENLLNGGFDWWYQPSPHVALALDTSVFHSGTRSLSISFDGQNAPEAGLSQLVAVKPDTEYAFSAESKTEDIDSASGPRFAITDAYTNFSYFLSDDLLGTNPWHTQRARFRTGSETNLLLLKIVRQPANALIRGKIWIDDLKLVEDESKDPQR